MGDRDISPTLAMFNNHSCRLGCVYEAILRFIQVRLRTISDDSVSVVLFDATAKVGVEMEDMQEGVVNRLLYERLKTSSYLPERWGKLSWKGPLCCVEQMKRADPRMILNTIMFGRDPTMNILIEMAKQGGGNFEQTLDEIQLARSFENLAESLKPQVAALM
ncbi:hypothetical protein SUGI_0602780 [Cryptomeria japonica]|nr:hypothetical protein SUGI_0602780 [Cryptomeria japonica]